MNPLMELACKDMGDKLFRTCQAFPSKLNQKIPLEVHKKLLSFPSFEKYYDPNVPRWMWLNPWFKECDEATLHNEQILGELGYVDKKTP